MDAVGGGLRALVPQHDDHADGRDDRGSEQEPRQHMRDPSGEQDVGEDPGLAQPCPPAARSVGRSGRAGACPSSYLVKYQYSGSRVNIGLKVTPFTLLVTAWMANGCGTGTHMNGSCCAVYVA